VRIPFSIDELILVLVSLIRATDPRLLRQGSEGFTVDFESLEAKKDPTPDERLLLRLRGALDTTGEETSCELELSMAERQRLVETLDSLEHLQSWPADVLAMSNDVQARLLMGE